MMAAVMETHVQTSEDDAELHGEDVDDLNDSEGGSEDGGSEGEGSEAGDGDEGSEGGEAEDEDGGEDEEGDEGNTNAGWAEAMAKILGKETPESQTSILVKNKQLDKIKEKEKQEQLERKKQIDKKREWEMMCREKPDVVKDRETEKTLQRIATRGVVQLFNAVRKHQKIVDEKVKEVGGSERKKAKILSSVSKKDFIDVLRRTEGGSAVRVKTEKDSAPAEEEDEKPAWSVLRDDFMMGATMKDWDKDSDREGEDEAVAKRGDDDDSDSD
ncbi:RRP15-like protein isoform X1 [Sphaeramia orbicularis]|uniref:RRP15-like protein isoform X1 n=1 Tax=Sphaeramia orbicularis TaxID=375764 RepID=UPI00117E8024|nr:RRP15-like protein isoform X1 [Sphaeramia orbicularis]